MVPGGGANPHEVALCGFESHLYKTALHCTALHYDRQAIVNNTDKAPIDSASRCMLMHKYRESTATKTATKTLPSQSRLPQ